MKGPSSEGNGCPLARASWFLEAGAVVPCLLKKSSSKMREIHSSGYEMSRCCDERVADFGDAGTSRNPGW